MTKQQIFKTVNDRATQMLKDSNIYKLYQSKENETIAKEWILNQALITLLYSHEERKSLISNKA